MSAPCGTRAGHGRHVAQGETPCASCRTAFNRYLQAWRVQNGRASKIQIGVDVLAAVLAGDLDVLRMALGPDLVTALGISADLEASRRRRDAGALAAAPEVVERLAPPPDPALDTAWSAIHDERTA